MQTLKIEAVPCVVTYNEKLFLCYKIVDGKARLIDDKGDKYSGTPAAENCQVVKQFEYRTFNEHHYVKTKLGVYSMSTGNKVKMPDIMKLFAE